jgi:pimeloyl-ACP methyl ester carboxylesterase
LAFANTDFRHDVENINVLTLIIHGSSDETVPINASSDRTARMIPDAVYKVYDGAPHGLFYTHRQQLNQDLIEFCQAGIGTAAGVAQQRVSM